MAISLVLMENEARIYGMRGPRVASLTPAQRSEKPPLGILSGSHGGAGASGDVDAAERCRNRALDISKPQRPLSSLRPAYLDL